MKRSLLIILFAFLGSVLFAQGEKIYDPSANAEEDVSKAIQTAKASGKHVFLQIGGNWCPWCVKFHKFLEADKDLSAFVKERYEVVKVNYDTKNKQEKLLTSLGFPQRFGFPVFVVLDGQGNRIHTQNSAFLEKDKSYDKDKLMRFFKNWSPVALDPASYKK